MPKYHKKIIAAAVMAVCAVAFIAHSNIFHQSDIRLNTVGFRPGDRKIANTPDSITMYAIRQAGTTGTNVERWDAVPEPRLNTDTQERLWTIDFSSFEEPGRYYIVASRGGNHIIQSLEFTIADDVFVEPYQTMMLGMYLWRCGMPQGVDATFGGTRFRHGACHLHDGFMPVVVGEDPVTRGEYINGVGGWHDAGDYNKYIVNSGVTVGLMLKAWENFWHIIKDIPLTNVGNSGNIPAYLAEIKWNLDWVEKMQFEDGRVSHKLTTINFGIVQMPNEETADRFYMPWSTHATGAFIAMMAQASRIFRPYDGALADRYLAAARKSYDVYAESPAVGPTNSMSSTGFYDSPNSEPGQRRWAAAEMWETTGEERFLEDLESRLTTGDVRDVTEWANVHNLAAMTYLNSRRPGKNEDLVERLHGRLITIADGIVNNTQTHGYGRPITSYYWGVNGAVASTTYTLYQAYRHTGDEKYRRAAYDAVSHLLGRNHWGRSYVTRVGGKSPEKPYDRRSNTSGHPWPGYLVGGPHTQASEAMPQGSSCTRAATCWFDSGTDYARNEVAQNWNSAMIYALASMMPGSQNVAQCYPGELDDPNCEAPNSIRHTTKTQQRGAAPNIRATRIVNTRGGIINIPPGASVYTLNGRLVAKRGLNDASMPVVRRNGVFIVKMEMESDKKGF